MPHLTSLESLHLTGAWLTIGVFDGVHRGHQEIIRQLTAGARANGAPAVLLSFAPHPAVVFGAKNLKCLTTPEERAEIIEALGVEFVITQTFDKNVANQTAEEYMALMVRHLGLKKLLIGYDFALGRGRAGTYQKLTQIGQELGFEVTRVEAIRFEDGIVSSSVIRQLLTAGDAAGAAAKLGRYYALSGPVNPGDGRGRTIGIPTANISVPTDKVLPANGVYACYAWVDAQKYRAVTNVGVRPTFDNGQNLARVEAHLLDASADYYHKTMRLEFVERLRGEQKFPAVEALVAQIHADIDQARRILSP
ncbi:MAG: bifunctional riboflavin kinase/FAD synthetase [Anaerolineales bacterium]|jgi:riboflavin kinase/FMN adenylyltransferase|nr:bifunctional riboflavin kinase/FAD synthetase [Anaerolineales bacterium]